MPTNPPFVIVTGLSGAGKTKAIHCFEDLGFFCVDNLPPALIPKFAELWAQSGSRVPGVAIVTDARGGVLFDDLQTSLDDLHRMGFDYRILFLEASEEALVSRFKELRRRHTLMSGNRTLLQSIQEERHRLEEVRGQADKVIDTTNLTDRELKDEVASLFVGTTPSAAMLVNIISFGFKYGLPTDADLVFDVRFLPNPHYSRELRPLTGLDKPVADFVLNNPSTREYLKRICGLVEFTIPLHREEGRAILTIAVGCTGGRHRAVTIANELRRHLRRQGHRVVLEHRDIHKDAEPFLPKFPRGKRASTEGIPALPHTATKK